MKRGLNKWKRNKKMRKYFVEERLNIGKKGTFNVSTERDFEDIDEREETDSGCHGLRTEKDEVRIEICDLKKEKRNLQLELLELEEKKLVLFKEIHIELNEFQYKRNGGENIIQSLKVDLTELSKRNKELTNDLNTSRECHNEMYRDMKYMRDLVKKTQRENSILKGKLKASENEIQDLNYLLTTITTDNSELQKKCDVLEYENHFLREEKEKTGGVVKYLMSKIKSSKPEMSRFSKKIQPYYQRIRENVV